MGERCFTVKGLAEYLACAESTIRRALTDPQEVRLEHLRVRGGIRITEAQVKLWQTRLRKKRGPNGRGDGRRVKMA